MVTIKQANSTAAKCTTVGVMNAAIEARFSSLKMLEPIDTAMNIRPTSVADAVPTRT